jgi:hypothetical protein
MLQVQVTNIWINSDGLHQQDNYDNAANYPDLESTLKSARLHGSYSLRDNLPLKIAYCCQDCNGDDWDRDGIGFATLCTVLGLGADIRNQTTSGMVPGNHQVPSRP